jgi:hypothetical protein
VPATLGAALLIFTGGCATYFGPTAFSLAESFALNFLLEGSLGLLF